MAYDPSTLLPAYTPSVPSKTLHVDGHESSLHQTDRQELRGLKAAVGLALGTPTAGKVIRGTGVGTSEWGAVQTGDIVADAATHVATQAIGSTSTSSAVLADISGSSISFTGSGGVAYATISLLALANGSACTVNVNWNVGGSDVASVLLNETLTAGAALTKTYMILIGTVSGAQTYKLRWSTSAGTLSIGAGNIHIFEFKR